MMNSPLPQTIGDPLILGSPAWMDQHQQPSSCSCRLSELVRSYSPGNCQRASRDVHSKSSALERESGPVAQLGKTVMRSDVIVCGLNTSSHVYCRETRKRLRVDYRVEARAMMTLCVRVNE